MKRYKATLKHDKGVRTLNVWADDERAAIKKICDIELCPEHAIAKIELVPFYVSMIDKFMSGWGMAQGKKNKFIVVCETYEEAQTIYRNAQRRDEMKYIKISQSKPKSKAGVIESFKQYSQLGKIWKQ